MRDPADVRMETSRGRVFLSRCLRSSGSDRLCVHLVLRPGRFEVLREAAFGGLSDQLTGTWVTDSEWLGTYLWAVFMLQAKHSSACEHMLPQLNPSHCLSLRVTVNPSSV